MLKVSIHFCTSQIPIMVHVFAEILRKCYQKHLVDHSWQFNSCRKHGDKTLPWSVTAFKVVRCGKLCIIWWLETATLMDAQFKTVGLTLHWGTGCCVCMADGRPVGNGRLWQPGMAISGMCIGMGGSRTLFFEDLYKKCLRAPYAGACSWDRHLWLLRLTISDWPAVCHADAAARSLM